MFTTSRTGSLAGLLFAGLMTGQGTAHAYTYIEKCDGDPVMLDTLQLDLNRNACSIPDGSLRQEMYEQTATLYNRASAIPVFTDTVTTDCQVEFGDWLNEVAVTTRSNIDGNNGLTFYEHENICFADFGPGDYGETDTFVASDMKFANPPQEFFGTQIENSPGGGRVTLVHEIAHMLGLDDTGPAFNHMNLENRRPMRGGTGAHAAPFPDEIAGLRSIYGTKQAVNLFASPQGWFGNQLIQNLHDTDRTLCRNGGMLQWTSVNLGHSNQTFDQRMVLSTDSTLSAEDRTWITWFGGTVGARNFFTWAGAFLVPANIPNGTYHLFHVISSPAEDVTQVDNHAHHAGRVTITDC